MSNYIYEEPQSQLYSNFTKEFRADQKEDIKQYIRMEFKDTSSEYFCFILIKHKGKIIDTERQLLKSYYCLSKTIRNIFKEKEPLEKIENKIDFKIKNIRDEIKKDITYKVIIIKNIKENKDLIKVIKKQVCEIDELLSPWDYEKSFIKQIFDNKLYIFSFGVVALTLTLIYRLSELGIIINFISIDTLTLSINIVNGFILVGLVFLLCISFLYSIAIIYLDDYISKITCKHPKFNFTNILKSFIAIYLILYNICIFGLITYDFFSYYRNSYISNNIVRDYLVQTREPSLREIKYKNENKNILLMGKDNKFIYFLNIEDIKNDINTKIQKQICNKDIKDSYIDSLIALLHIKQNLDDNNKESKLNYISNRRYRTLQISNIIINESVPSFKELFCDIDIKSSNK